MIVSLLTKLTVGALAAAGVIALGSRSKPSARVTKREPAKSSVPGTRARRKRQAPQKRAKSA